MLQRLVTVCSGHCFYYYNTALLIIICLIIIALLIISTPYNSQITSRTSVPPVTPDTLRRNKTDSTCFGKCSGGLEVTEVTSCI
jgi:hypothetical protein